MRAVAATATSGGVNNAAGLRRDADEGTTRRKGISTDTFIVAARNQDSPSRAKAVQPNEPVTHIYRPSDRPEIYQVYPTLIYYLIYASHTHTRTCICDSILFSLSPEPATRFYAVLQVPPRKSFTSYRILNRFRGKSRPLFRDNLRIAPSYSEKLISTLSSSLAPRNNSSTCSRVTGSPSLYTAYRWLDGERKAVEERKRGTLRYYCESHFHGPRRIELRPNSRYFAPRLRYLISISKLISRVNCQPRVRRRDIRERMREGIPLERDTWKNVVIHGPRRKNNRGESSLSLSLPLARRVTRASVICRLHATSFEYVAFFIGRIYVLVCVARSLNSIAQPSCNTLTKIEGFRAKRRLLGYLVI